MSNQSEWTRGQPLTLEDVVVRRGGRLLLEGLNLTLEPARRYVLIGASGAGKSTLLRLLNRLDDPDSGRILVGDRLLSSLPIRDVRSAIGLVFQNPRPLPGSLADNLIYPHQVRGWPTLDRTQQAEALEEVGLDPAWLDRDASSLSGGERQRLAIATSLGLEPEILALDEPTSALDPASSLRVASSLARRSARSRLRTIVVTHSRDQAEKLGDFAIRLELGRVVDLGPVDEVLGRESGMVAR